MTRLIKTSAMLSSAAQRHPWIHRYFPGEPGYEEMQQYNDFLCEAVDPDGGFFAAKAPGADEQGRARHSLPGVDNKKEYVCICILHDAPNEASIVYTLLDLTISNRPLPPRVIPKEAIDECLVFQRKNATPEQYERHRQRAHSKLKEWEEKCKSAYVDEKNAELKDIADHVLRDPVSVGTSEPAKAKSSKPLASAASA